MTTYRMTNKELADAQEFVDMYITSRATWMGAARTLAELFHIALYGVYASGNNLGLSIRERVNIELVIRNMVWFIDSNDRVRNIEATQIDYRTTVRLLDHGTAVEVTADLLHSWAVHHEELSGAAKLVGDALFELQDPNNTLARAGLA